MTSYEVNLCSSNTAGEANNMSSLVAAMAIVEKFFNLGQATNLKWCEECKQRPYPQFPGEVYHSFMIREKAALKIVRNVEISWKKKKGIARQSPVQYLESLSENCQEQWFQLELSDF
jgi:hypothetical protein